MKKYKKILGKILGLILLILPLQYLWVRPFELQSSSELAIFLLTNWYEVLLLLAVPGLFMFVVRKKNLFWFDWLLLVLLILSFLSSLWSPATGWIDLIGLRYAVGFIGFYFVARTLNDWKPNEKLILFTFYAVVGIALFQGLFWLTGSEASSWFLVKRHLAGDLPRLYGPMIGPNQLGTYVACLSLWLYYKRLISGWSLTLAFAVVVATFSRSAILGMIAGLVIIGYQQRSVIRWKLFGFTLAVVFVLSALAFTLFPNAVNNTLVGSRHTEERVNAFQLSINHFSRADVATKLFGHGVTTAGPSTFVTDRVFVPENWFLQVLHEQGIVGLIILLAALIGALVFLSKSGSVELTSVFVAMAVNSLFLHPLSDNPTASITIFVLLAAAINTQVRRRMLN